MNRRLIVRLIGAVVALAGAGATGRVLGSSAKATNNPHGLPEDVRFTHGVHAAQLPDGSWNLWVRAAAVGAERREQVHLRLEVATDESFADIVHSEPIIADQQRSYIVRMNVSLPETSGLPFVFRFVVLDSPAMSLRSTGDDANLLPHSPVGVLAPSGNM